MTAAPLALPAAAAIELDGRTLTPATVAAIAAGSTDARLTPAARARNTAARAALDALIAE